MEALSTTAEYVLKFVNQTNKSIFLTGKAGTGKTTLLKEIIRTTHKNVIVVAPTGIAALNAGGVTIHSMFQLPFAAFIPAHNLPFQYTETVKFESRDSLRHHFKMRGDKKSVIQNLDLLVIDEVSMLRADVLDAMDYMLRTVRKSNNPFGGVQVLFIGDLLQLPPVIKNEEWDVLKKYYRGKFFFHALVVQQNPPLYIELTKIYRQTDERFISVLNNLRDNVITPNDIKILNSFVNPGFDTRNNPGYITLTTHNAKADALNAKSLDSLKGRQYIYRPDIVGEFPEKIFPVDEELKLKVGAQVMFIKNDLSPDKNYFNGKIGFIKSLSDEEVLVHFPEENFTIEVERYEWKNVKYSVDELTKEIKEDILGTYVHYPIKLAWAITVHKSQGLTFDKAVLDVSGVFLPGQAYVALSRLRSLEGLILLSPVQMNGISNDADVMDYSSAKAAEEELETSLKAETHSFIFNFLINSFEWSELATTWQKHRISYMQEGEKALKSKYRIWAQQQEEQMHKLIDPALKFKRQLERLFSAKEADMDFVHQRIIAAYDYFFPSLDRLAGQVLGKMEEIKRIRKAKGYYEELSELEELQTAAVVKLMKAKLLMKLSVDGREITKESILSPDITNYKRKKLEAIRAAEKANPSSFLEEEAGEYLVEKKAAKKLNTGLKKSTYDETLEMWQQKLSVSEIAGRRKLTENTVNGHLAKLVQAGSIQISDILPQERLYKLAEAFKDFDGESLNSLKEKHPDEFSWDELKLFRASLNTEAVKG